MLSAKKRPMCSNFRCNASTIIYDKHTLAQSQGVGTTMPIYPVPLFSETYLQLEFHENSFCICCLSAVQSFWSFAQSTATMLPCSVQIAIGPQEWNFVSSKCKMAIRGMFYTPLAPSVLLEAHSLCDSDHFSCVAVLWNHEKIDADISVV